MIKYKENNLLTRPIIDCDEYTKSLSQEIRGITLEPFGQTWKLWEEFETQHFTNRPTD